jgi:hypothetical protein
LQKVERFLEHGVAVIELLIADAKRWKQIHHLTKRPNQDAPVSRQPAQHFPSRVEVTLFVCDDEIKGCDGSCHANTLDAWVACQSL